jgi:hypothetical protein
MDGTKLFTFEKNGKTYALCNPEDNNLSSKL